MRSGLLVLGLWAAASCASAEVRVAAFTPAMAKEADASARLIRGQFDREMLDYPAARFRDVRAIRGPKGGVRFCGFVNGKNRLAAYSGWKEFLATNFDGTPDVDVRPEGDILVDTLCHGGNGIQDSRDYSADLTHR